MTIFVDASAMVALIGREPEAQALLAGLETHETRITSGLAVWEAVRAVAKRGGDLGETARLEVDRLRTTLRVALVAIGVAEADEAIRAHARYGKGTGHPAKLNMGDCFAYACAKTNGARLLYKGDDFIHTDLA